MHQSIESYEVAEAEAEVARIQKALEEGRGTKAAVTKLIRAHLSAASDMVHLGMATPLVSKFAKADWGNVEEAEELVDDAEFCVGTTILRHKLKCLCEMFGSTENLKAYIDALKANTSTETRDSTPQVSALPTKVLYNILVANLKSKLVKVGEFQTCVTPAELCEIIALKVALKIDHVSLRVPENEAHDTMMRRLASWLQRRRDRHGSMRPEDLERSPAARPIRDFRDTEEFLGVVDENGKVVSIGLSDAETWAHDVTRTVITSESRFFSTFKYETENVVEGSAKFMPLPERAPKDWDALSIMVKKPGTFVDRRLSPDDKGTFPMTYSGPSFVFIEDGKLVLPNLKCERCDGMLWYQWHQAGEQGECPKCKHVHMRPEMIREDHWEPRVWVTNEYVDDRTGETWKKFTSYQGRRDMMHCKLTPSASGKTSKWKFHFDHPDMGASIFVRIYRDTVMGVVRTALSGENNVMSHAPILEETFVTNVYRQSKDFEYVRKDEDGVEHGRRNKRPTTLHIFVPVRKVLYMFDPRTLPIGYRNMHLQMQLSGKYEHLVEVNRQLGGTHLRSIYTQTSTKEKWTLDRQYWVK